MYIGHYHNAGDYLDYDDASVLFPVEELSATVHTHRDAELILRDADSESVLVVKPTGFASSYALTQRPLTVIEIASMNDDTLDHIQSSVDDPGRFEYIQVGRATRSAQNRSLAEY
ncbi:hypothetical protein [Halorientalis regularis]|jgi:hypothetical protein|uniref:DUF8165 domain-containing protein n=1 Tax=Halorientalis regularis TaxID=660518 RepID=A0A1G7QCC2_9EURY|nr:hypothetical protein [Halorientalis regularis]SDF96201.1 hypothetical protein SAMN05216218_11282 [Halorientalis regularis]